MELNMLFKNKRLLTLFIILTTSIFQNSDAVIVRHYFKRLFAAYKQSKFTELDFDFSFKDEDIDLSQVFNITGFPQEEPKSIFSTLTPISGDSRVALLSPSTLNLILDYQPTTALPGSDDSGTDSDPETDPETNTVPQIISSSNLFASYDGISQPGTSKFTTPLIMDGEDGRGIQTKDHLLLETWMRNLSIGGHPRLKDQTIEEISQSLSSFNEVHRSRILNQVLNTPKIRNSRFPNGAGLLHIAADQGLRYFVEQLIDWGADVNLAAGDKFPISYALERRDVRLLRILVSRGAEFLVSPDLDESP